tara:strand:- start:109 stop:1209 length:1101 start_codon:yes stop_codon:yes gene_type:complete
MMFGETAQQAKDNIIRFQTQNYFDKLDAQQKDNAKFLASLAGGKVDQVKALQLEALEDMHGKDFLDQYRNLDFIDQGSVGSVFAKKGDKGNVIKAQRATEDEDQLDPDTGTIGIARKSDVDREIDAQLTAAELGVAPRINTVENILVPKRKYTFPDISKRNPSPMGETLNIINMERVNTLAEQGGIDNVVDQYVRRFDLTGDKAKQMTTAGHQKAQLAFAKAKLRLMDKGIVHNDLGGGRNVGEREDHISYDPFSNEMKIIDYGRIKRFKHVDNLHQHTKNQNLIGEEMDDMSPFEQARHLLDHRVTAVLQGMKAVGNKDLAGDYQSIYDESRDKGDLREMEDIADQGKKIIEKQTMKDVTNRYLQ